MNNDLLTPSLDQDASGKPIYSVQAAFFVAFFGGPFAITLFTAQNSKILGRFKKEKFIYIFVFIALAGTFLWALTQYGNFNSFGELLSSMRQERELRFGAKVTAVLLWAVFYQLHKKYHKAMALFGTESPSPWKAGLTCAAIDFAVRGVVIAGLFYILG